MKVLFATSEAYPFAASGGLADVSGALPKALRSRFIGARVIMPLYDTISEEMREKLTFVTAISVPVAWRRQYCGIFKATVDGVVYYLVDNQYYFDVHEKPSVRDTIRPTAVGELETGRGNQIPLWLLGFLY